MTIERVLPGDAGYEELQELFKTGETKRFDYDHLADEYNSSPLGTALLADFNNRAQLANIERVMDKYGVLRNFDYELSRVKTNVDDETGEVLSCIIGIKKLSTKPMVKD